MAEDQVGMRTEPARALPLWTKLFTAFRVALDPKKLVLAAAGLVVMAFGWWLLSVIFYNARTRPIWSNYVERYKDEELAWKAFKQDRIKWNQLYQMAGPVPGSIKEARDVASYDTADIAETYEEFDKINKEQKQIRAETSFRGREVRAIYDTKADNKSYLQVVGTAYTIPFDPPKGADKDGREKLVQQLNSKNLTAGTLNKAIYEQDKTLKIGNLRLANVPPERWESFLKELSSSKSLDEIDQEIREGRRPNPEIARKALQLAQLEGKRFKPAGYLRTWPWWEQRGPNPYLLVTGSSTAATPQGLRTAPWAEGRLLAWFASDEVPVLLEPLVKFLRPVVYLLQPGAGFWNRIYLILIILWTLATWALFGGAITRMAVVQVARSNEKVGMTEALRFAWSRYQSFLSAPLLPLIFMAILTVFLLILGWIIDIWLIGEVLTVILFPLGLILGLIMAVVLVGLVGWPMMYATISAEGSDSFDAISRSYSYVYQAPWHYLWYAGVALVYGAAMVFFIGLMGSLLVYLTRWGLGLVPLAAAREPSYLFAWAPSSFGWRDLLLYNSPHARVVDVVQQNGTLSQMWVLHPTDAYEFTVVNKIGTFLVSCWLFLVFLLVVGFGYSFFWTSSTIIYLLMRHKVDDTDLDEIHLEEEAEEPYVPPKPAPAEQTPPTSPPGKAPVTMLEPPALRNPPGAPATPPTATSAVGPPESEPPPTSPAAQEGGNSPPASAPEAPPPASETPPPTGDPKG
jgi:hypothetical protein